MVPAAPAPLALMPALPGVTRVVPSPPPAMLCLLLPAHPGEGGGSLPALPHPQHTFPRGRLAPSLNHDAPPVSPWGTPSPLVAHPRGLSTAEWSGRGAGSCFGAVEHDSGSPGAAWSQHRVGEMGAPTHDSPLVLQFWGEQPPLAPPKQCPISVACPHHRDIWVAAGRRLALKQSLLGLFAFQSSGNELRKQKGNKNNGVKPACRGRLSCGSARCCVSSGN